MLILSQRECVVDTSNQCTGWKKNEHRQLQWVARCAHDNLKQCKAGHMHACAHTKTSILNWDRKHVYELKFGIKNVGRSLNQEKQLITYMEL